MVQYQLAYLKIMWRNINKLASMSDAKYQLKASAGSKAKIK